MSDYETVPNTKPRSIEISGIKWNVESLQIFPKCFHKHKSCQCFSYTITGEATEDSVHTGWETNGAEAPQYDIGPEGYYVHDEAIKNHEEDLEPYIEEHCEVCNV